MSQYAIACMAEANPQGAGGLMAARAVKTSVCRFIAPARDKGKVLICTESDSPLCLMIRSQAFESKRHGNRHPKIGSYACRWMRLEGREGSTFLAQRVVIFKIRREVVTAHCIFLHTLSFAPVLFPYSTSFAMALVTPSSPYDNVNTADLYTVKFDNLFDGDEQELTTLLKACERDGFFYLDLQGSGSGKLWKDLDRVGEIAKRWFAQPAEVKLETPTLSLAHGFVSSF